VSIHVVLCNNDGDFFQKIHWSGNSFDGVNTCRYPQDAKLFANPYVAEKEAVYINENLFTEEEKFFIQFYKTMYVFGLPDDDRTLLKNEDYDWREELAFADLEFQEDPRLAKSFSLLPDANEFASCINSKVNKDGYIMVKEVPSLDNHFAFCKKNGD